MEEREPSCTVYGNATGSATMERSRVVLKIKKDLPFDPEIPLLGINLKDPKTLIQNDISTPIYIAALFTIAKIWKQPKFHQQISG